MSKKHPALVTLLPWTQRLGPNALAGQVHFNPLLVEHADVLAEVGSDDEFEVGLAALIAGFRHLIDPS